MLRNPDGTKRRQWGKLLRRTAGISGGLAVVAAIVVAMLPRAQPVDMEQVVTGPLVVTVDEEGKTRVRERYIVSAPLMGRMQRIELDPGDEVGAGQTLLAVIEPSDPSLLDPRARAEAEARVKAAEASVEAAQPNLERAKAALDFARNEFERAKQMYETKTAPLVDFENTQLLLRTRVEELRSAELGQQIAQFELEQAKAALLRTRPEAEAGSDNHFEIRSPINGRVLRVRQESAGIVTPGTELVELGDPADLEVEIDVLSSDAVKMRVGTRIILEQWGGDHPLNATVKRIEPSAFTKISALGVEEQRVYVVGDLNDTLEDRSALGDGFRVEARIVIWESPQVLLVPTSALFRQGEEWAVFCVADGRAQTRVVKIGHRNALQAEVVEGLREGDTVIVHPGDSIKDQIRVQRRA
ncbi:MAG: HlyD family efflux transporter periplasmic adaptor subunit [Pirellulales bacterium]|nr:HlyD family efflux transporter periplasmic adaptor subunit [Pirellulales bacterium]